MLTAVSLTVVYCATYTNLLDFILAEIEAIEVNTFLACSSCFFFAMFYLVERRARLEFLERIRNEHNLENMKIILNSVPDSLVLTVDDEIQY